MVPRAHVSVSALLGSCLTAALAAQNPAAEPIVAPAPQPAAALRFDVAPTLTFLAAAPPGVEVGPIAWRVLAFAASDSTMKRGTYRAQVRTLTKQLIDAQIPGDGRFVVDGSQCSRRDQCAGALALVVAWVESQHRPLMKPALDAAKAAARACADTDGGGAKAEDAALLAALVPVLARWPKDAPGFDRAEAVRLEFTQAARAALARHTFGPSRRHDAALCFGQLALGTVQPPELTLARVWPADLAADPLHTFFALASVGNDPLLVGKQADLLAAFVAQRAAQGDGAGTWPAFGEKDTTAAAMLAAALGCTNGWATLSPPR